MAGGAGLVTTQSLLQSQSQAAALQQQPTATTSRLSDPTSIPEGIVQATASVCSMFRRSSPSAGTSPSHIPAQNQDVVPGYQNDASAELERLYGEDWRNLDPQMQVNALSEQQQQEFYVLRLQRDALLSENAARNTDLQRVIHEHSMQTTSLQEVIRTLEGTRSEQQELQRLADEREDELMQLRLQQRSATGGQPPGLPNPWGMRMLEQAAQQRYEPLIRDVTNEDPNAEIPSTSHGSVASGLQVSRAATVRALALQTGMAILLHHVTVTTVWASFIAIVCRAHLRGPLRCGLFLGTSFLRRASHATCCRIVFIPLFRLLI
eukprot:3287362-Amphidinium_carterae.1